MVCHTVFLAVKKIILLMKRESEMKLSKCKHGTIVQDVDGIRIGMIVGITNNCPSADLPTREELSNAIVLVQWSFGETYGIHPKNIKPYRD